MSDHYQTRAPRRYNGAGRTLTIVFQPMSLALDSEKPGISLSQHHVGRPLLTPDEVRNLPQHLELLFLAGQRPIVARKLKYFEDREFAGLFR